MAENHLGKAVNLVDVGVQAVRDRNVDQPVVGPEWHCRFGPLLCEWVQACASTAPKNNAQNRLLNAWKGLREVLQGRRCVSGTCSSSCADRRRKCCGGGV
jgi:hypothetical protein